ncbi:hypothetical protein [Lysobacter sp. CA199]|uniref:hypothetical protein n=1 Tax=Lysobacter sp. CA199 TaxID=3455608 RepID=UPI003F8D59DE
MFNNNRSKVAAIAAFCFGVAFSLSSMAASNPWEVCAERALTRYHECLNAGTNPATCLSTYKRVLALCGTPP